MNYFSELKKIQSSLISDNSIFLRLELFYFINDNYDLLNKNFKLPDQINNVSETITQNLYFKSTKFL